jgi:hypothetical protein
LKYVYRVIILLAIFIGALYYFSGDIKEVVFDNNNTTIMSEATFPFVTIKSGENVINLLHGYSTNLAANKLRESVIPLTLDKTFEVQIRQEDYIIKKLNYEVRDFQQNSLIEQDSVSVFEEVENVKTAKIRLTSELDRDREYAVKITLITSKSQKIYFYQRIKIYENPYLSEKLNFILDFHEAIMDKSTAEAVTKYLEPSATADNSSLAYVNINSSFDLVTWGNLRPTILTKPVPTIIEIYADTILTKLEYCIEAEVEGNKEQYQVAEFYRVRYTPDRMYLLNYERKMEALFDISLAKISEGKLKLGITSDIQVPVTSSADQRKLAFVRNRELWFYDLENNKITKVFSFRSDNKDDLRELYDQHDIRVLNMDEEGNLDFMVYGYMNRGQYEGRVAIILYRFIRSENRIEERLYIPVEEPYQTLKEKLGKLSYVNSRDVFYFQVYNSIYSYDMITRELEEIADKVTTEQVVVLKDLNYVAWQDSVDPNQSKNIIIMNLETGETQKITARQGYRIRLMDAIDSNLIYGYVSEEDIAEMMDGSVMAPLSVVEIASVDKKVLKSYSKDGYYISGLEVKDNIIELRRVQKLTEDGRTAYVLAPQDYIMNQVKKQTQLINISREDTRVLSEYYLHMPQTFEKKELPEVISSVSTIIEEDPTVRLPISGQELLCYYPYISGGIEGAYANAADAIAIAKKNIGVVLNNNQQLIWERGVKAAKNTIVDFESMSWSTSSDKTVETCLKLLLSYQKVAVAEEQLSVDHSSVYEVLKQYSKYTPIRLTGITLEDALYYVSKGRPLIAMTDVSHAVIIFGYDAFNITMINPSEARIKKMGIGDSTKMFEAAGNVFLSYLEQ